MANYGDGTIEIPLENFWTFVFGYHEHENAELFYGVPRINTDMNTMEIDYMFNTGCNPQDEVGFEESKCKKQWNELKKKQS